jgi:hypothetical protein
MLVKGQDQNGTERNRGLEPTVCRFEVVWGVINTKNGGALPIGRFENMAATEVVYKQRGN